MTKAWKHETAQDFRGTVDAALAPIQREQARGIQEIYFGGESARIRMNLAEVALEYFTFDLAKEHHALGVGVLPFVPSHGVDISKTYPSLSSGTAHAIFGVRDDDTIVRGYSEFAYNWVSPRLPVEELNDEVYVRHLIDVMRSPQIYSEHVDTILAVTPEQRELIDAAHEEAVRRQQAYLATMGRYERLALNPCDDSNLPRIAR